MNLLVSIITPNFNSFKYLKETIISVQNQTYGIWEMIIVDDNSTDDSIKLIKEFAKKDDRIKLIELQENVGPAVARNTGIKLAKGNYLTFIDSDDIWLNDFLAISIEKIQNSNGFVFASYHCYDENLNPKFKDAIAPAIVTYTDILKTNSISCLTAFIDINKLGKLYMPEIRYRQDMGLWLEYLKKIKFAKGIKIPLAIYRIRPNSHSRNKINLLRPQWYFYRNVENLSIIKSAYYFIIWMFYGLKKYYF